MTSRASLVLLLVAALAGCPEPSAPSAAVGAVATVGPRTVLASDLVLALEGLARMGELPREPAFSELRKRTLDARIVEEVLLAEADVRGLRPTPEQVEAELVALRGDTPGSGVDEEGAALYGSPAAWRAVVARRMAVRAAEAALREELRQGTSVTPEQVEAAIPRYADRLARPGRLRARQLFDPDPETVRALHARLEAGEDFAALATELGLPDGGDLGAMTLDGAPTLLVQASADLDVGEHTPVLKSPLGYHVFQLVSRTPPGDTAPEEAAALVEDWLLEEAVESRLRAWLAGRTDELGVTVHEDVLARIVCCRDGGPWIAPPQEVSR